MIYEAIYSGAAYEGALEDAAWLIRSDRYYGMYRPREYGTGLIGRYSSGGVWGRWYVGPADGPTVTLDTLDDVTVDLVRSLLPEVGWTSCKDNRLLYRFNHDARTVTLLVDSRRHGIPSRALQEFTPDRVLRYETQEPTWKWWETADMHRAAA